MTMPPTDIAPAILLVMGVSGSGKSTIAAALAEHFGWPFLEGDSFHTAANIAKMAAGTPLTDEDRGPWLARLAEEIHVWSAAGQAGIVTCSALKRAYRRILLEGVPEARIVYLTGARAVLESRMTHREGHFMPSTLLDSQIATLEVPTADERPITLDIAETLSQMVQEVEAALNTPVKAGGTTA